MRNMDAFMDVAQEALGQHQLALAAFMKDRSASAAQRFRQRSIRHAIVAITSSWNYLEASLYYHGRRKLGRNYNDNTVFEAKLKALGIADEGVLEKIKQLRILRRDLIHGKALEIDSVDPSKAYVAQNEAELAVALALEIQELLGCVACSDCE